MLAIRRQPCQPPGSWRALCSRLAKPCDKSRAAFLPRIRTNSRRRSSVFPEGLDVVINSPSGRSSLMTFCSILDGAPGTAAARAVPALGRRRSRIRGVNDIFQHDDDSLVGPGERLLRIADVMDKTGLGRSIIYRRIADGTFPTLASSVRVSFAGNNPRLSAGSTNCLLPMPGFRRMGTVARNHRRVGRPFLRAQRKPTVFDFVFRMAA